MVISLIKLLYQNINYFYQYHVKDFSYKTMQEQGYNNKGKCIKIYVKISQLKSLLIHAITK